MSVTLFKDYHKETKDLLTKFYSKPNEWKVESKLRAAKDQLTINPVATEKEITCDVEYKTTPQEPGVLTLKASLKKDTVARVYATFERAQHKVDLSTDLSGNVEGAYEGRQGQFGVNAKATKQKAEAFVSASPYPGLNVGGGAAFNFKDKATSWSAGARFTEKRVTCDFFTSMLNSFTFGVVFPVTVDKYSFLLGAQADVQRNNFKTPKIEAGLETACIGFPGNKLKLRVNNDAKVTVAYVAQLPRWKAALTATSDKQVGAHFILE